MLLGAMQIRELKEYLDSVDENTIFLLNVTKNDEVTDSFSIDRFVRVDNGLIIFSSDDRRTE